MISASLLLGVAGCRRSGQSLDQRDENHPLMRRAAARREAQDIEGAVAAYKKALEKKPDLARAHLELGVLFDREGGDYLQAICHYRNYLEARPQTEKREKIEDLIKYANLSYAAALPNTSSEAVRMIARLQEENRALKKQILDLQLAARNETAGSVPDPGPRPAPPAADPSVRRAEGLQAPPPAPSVRQVETYLVQSGDTLSSIAHKVYKDRNQWQKIYDANRDVLPHQGALKPGQTLKIPRE